MEETYRIFGFELEAYLKRRMYLANVVDVPKRDRYVVYMEDEKDPYRREFIHIISGVTELLHNGLSSSMLGDYLMKQHYRYFKKHQ